MTIDVSRVVREVGAQMRVDASTEVPPVTIGGDDVGFDAVRCRLDLVYAGRRILVDGRLDTAAVMTCGRCLERYRHPLSVRFDREYRERPGPGPTFGGYPGGESPEAAEPGATGSGAGAPAGDDEVGYYAHGRVDLREDIREALVLSLPMKPLCRPDCPGLCPRCGHRLADGPCGCPADGPDLKWAPLMRYRGQDAQE